MVCVSLACLGIESPALKKIKDEDYFILVGLINRCGRLMHSNVALSHEGKFGETTSILDRCIFESCVILGWLCRTSNDDRFNRYIANGLRTEIEFKAEIEKNIETRDKNQLKIEKRMLSSIDRCINDSGLSEEEISGTKKLPDLASMINATGKPRLQYLVGQRIGSHHVHGSWVSLGVHYLERDDSGIKGPRDHDCDTHVNQYVYIPLVVLDAMSAFCLFVFEDSADSKVLTDMLESIADEIFKINSEVIGDDFAGA